MAEGILFNVAGELITKLGSRHIRTIGLWGGVKAELKKLENTVSMIQAVLLDAEEQYSKSNQVKIWVESLKEALYDAEDLLDEFSAHALRLQVMKGCGMAKEVRLFFSSSNQFAYGLKMAFEIKDRLKGIRENRSMFYLDEGCLKKHLKSEEREQTHSSAPKVVVGRENDKNEIIKILLSNYEENVSIVSIVGIGGLGKTTLAQFVYSDEIIETHFELKLWVSVSDHFDVRLIVAKILESVTGERHLDLEMNTLKNLLHDKINGRKYLLVLDDMWNENWERWFHLKELLAGGARGSRILVTSRLKNVADMIQLDSIYELKGASSKLKP
ncbi:putative disease resistance protein RGA3 [Hevea brasiliensis]|uniref:putative disease resistance protein RGA3 n=1 Tax=Hevea brasiliensis TaxID=3981 RepID=UPI0025F5F81B|nr:putative disease resistance protein RGA3 [Hevea brasiliensis]